MYTLSCFSNKVIYSVLEELLFRSKLYVARNSFSKIEGYHSASRFYSETYKIVRAFQVQLNISQCDKPFVIHLPLRISNKRIKFDGVYNGTDSIEPLNAPFYHQLPSFLEGNAPKQGDGRKRRNILTIGRYGNRFYSSAS